MNRIALIPILNKDIHLEHTTYITKKLFEAGIEVILPEGVSEKILFKKGANEDTIYKASDLIICLGGDGTLLKTARKACLYDKPVLGVNLGNVGFLAGIELSGIDYAIDKIVKGEIKINRRMLLDTEVYRNKEVVFKDISVNDVVVSRVALSRILHLNVFLDDQYVDFFPGDGMIVSTPTGSTAYTLSAGGPIVQPDVNIIITTPICPHILYSRSFITNDNKKVKIEIDHSYTEKAMLTIDGQLGFEILPGDCVVVSRSKKDVLFASIDEVNFYEVLRSKIYNRNRV